MTGTAIRHPLTIGGCGGHGTSALLLFRVT